MPNEKKIAAGIEGFAESLFGRHVRDRADRAAGAGEEFGSHGFAGIGGIGSHTKIGRAIELGQTEIENFSVAA